MKETSILEQTARTMLAAGMNPSEGARELRKQMIVEVLRETKGNVCRAALRFRMHRNTLTRQMDDLKIRHEALDRRADARAQRALKYGGRLPVNSPAMRKLVRSQQQPPVNVNREPVNVGRENSRENDRRVA